METKSELTPSNGPELQEESTTVIKAFTTGAASDAATALMEQLVAPEERLPSGALAPPYDFDKLYKLWELSSNLRPNIDAYVTNIESFGHHLMPIIDLTADDADQRISDAIQYEQAMAVNAGTISLAELSEPTDADIQQRKSELRKLARLEFVRLRAFFQFVCPTLSFTEMRRRTRQDLEVTGNAFWEIVRNELGEVANIYYAPVIGVYLMPKDLKPTLIEEAVRVTDITWTVIKRQHRFRRFVKTEANAAPLYFKEYGDTRIMSRNTGVFYTSIGAMRHKEPKAEPATELIHFTLATPSSAYGIPRWISALPAVLGTRENEEVNYNFFKNNVVPPLALLCSGGRLGKGVASRIEEFIEEHLKGRKGINRILVLEAEGQKAAGATGPLAVPKIQFVPLRDAQQSDAVFQGYDLRNEEKVARLFRLPRILRGDDKQINRATAWAALKFADEQIFEPERETFDDFMNRHLLPHIGVKFWAFRSNAPIVRDPEKMAEMLERLVRAGILVPREAREICSDIFNRAFADISEEWTNRPLPQTMAQLRHNTSDGDGHSESEPEPEAAPASAPAPEPSSNGAAPPRAGTPLKGLGEQE